MLFQIILTVLFYGLVAGILGALIVISRENKRRNQQDHADQQALIAGVMRSINASERSVASAEEKTVAIKEAVVVMQKAVAMMAALVRVKEEDHDDDHGTD